MNQEERAAVQELLKKIPEDELNKAVGGMSDRGKKILGATGFLAIGVGLGVGSTLLTHHLLKGRQTADQRQTRYKFPLDAITDVPYTKSLYDENVGKYHTAHLMEALNEYHEKFLKLNNLTEKDMSLDAFCDLCKKIKDADEKNKTALGYEEYSIP